jgi:hypothetical protein
MVTGPCMDVIFCRVKFFIRAWSRVVFPTLGGPTMATMIGGGSNGVLSTNGICCFFVSKSWALKKIEIVNNEGTKILPALKETSCKLWLIFDEPSDLPVKMFLSLGYWLDSKSLGVTLTGIHFLNVRILDFFLVRFAPYKFLPSLNVLIFKYCNPKSYVPARRSRWAFFLSSTWSSILAPFFFIWKYL